MSSKTSEKPTKAAEPLAEAKAEKPAAPLQAWRPDFESLQAEWQDLVHNFWSRPWLMPMANLRAVAAHHFQPALNVYSDQGNLIVEAALPGVEKKDVHIHVTRDTLAISGEYRQEKKDEADKYYHSEIRQGSFQRKVSLPALVNPEKVSAKLEEGILRITMALLDPSHQQGVKIAID